MRRSEGMSHLLAASFPTRPGHFWVPISRLARDYHCAPETIRRWCLSGFIVTRALQSVTRR